MAKRIPAAPAVSEQMLRNALIRELNSPIRSRARRRRLKHGELVAHMLVEKAEAGDLRAIREILDRVYGKAVPAPLLAPEPTVIITGVRRPGDGWIPVSGGGPRV